MLLKYLFRFSVFTLLTCFACEVDPYDSNEICDRNMIYPGINTKMYITTRVYWAEDSSPVTFEPLEIVVEKYPCEVEYATATETYTGQTDEEGYFYLLTNVLEVRNQKDDIIITATLNERDISKEKKTTFKSDWDGNPKNVEIRFYVPSW